MRKTRNERKRDLIERLAASFILLVVCFLIVTLLCGMACKVWAKHPAEQPISYEEYMERFGGADNAIQNR